MIENELLESVNRYMQTGAAMEFKSIMQTMNDTYNVGNCSSLKNGFNALRNVAVHETLEFCKAYEDSVNHLQAVFVVGSKTFRWSNIVYCLLAATRSHPGKQSLILFAKAIMKWRLGIEDCQLPCVSLAGKGIGDIVKTLADIGWIPKYYNVNDPYMQQLCSSDTRAFLLRAIPCPETVLSYAIAYPEIIPIISVVLEMRGCV